MPFHSKILLAAIFATLVAGFGPAYADTVNSETINVKNNTGSGSWPASINESHCNPAGSHSPYCTPSSGQLIPSGGSNFVTITETVGTYDTLITGSFQYVSKSIEPGGLASIAACTWTYKINKNSMTNVWSGTATTVVTTDSAQNYTPACGWSYNSVDPTTGQFTLTVTFK